MSCSQPRNNEWPISVTVSGNVASRREVQCKKHSDWMLVKPDDIVNFLRALHSAKALAPIDVTVGGISISSNEEQSKKLVSPIEVTVAGVAKVALFNEVQPLNELSAMLVTEAGIVISWRELQDSKVLSLISVSAGESVALLREVHPKKAFGLIDVTDGPITIELMFLFFLNCVPISGMS